jgi:hypothetical protein
MKRGKGGATEITKLTVDFRNCFAKPPEAKTHKFGSVPVTWIL